MRACPWEDIQSIISSIEEVQIVPGGTMDLLMPSISFVPSTSWLDFLNTDPTNSRSMWLIYRECVRCSQELQAWSTEKGYRYDGGAGSLSREEFLEQYPAEWQADAEKLHMGMRGTIDEGNVDVIKDVLQYTDQEKHSRAKEILTEGADILTLTFSIRITNPHGQAMTVQMLDPRQLQLQIPTADHPSLWLSALLGGLISSYEKGKIAQRCIACPIYFIPSPRGRSQKFHSASCRSRYNVAKWRQSHS